MLVFVCLFVCLLVLPSSWIIFLHAFDSDPEYIDCDTALMDEEEDLMMIGDTWYRMVSLLRGAVAVFAIEPAIPPETIDFCAALRPSR